MRSLLQVLGWNCRPGRLWLGLTGQLPLHPVLQLALLHPTGLSVSDPKLVRGLRPDTSLCPHLAVVERHGAQSLVSDRCVKLDIALGGFLVQPWGRGYALILGACPCQVLWSDHP